MCILLISQMFPVFGLVCKCRAFCNHRVSLWSQRKEAPVPLGSAAAAVPQTQAAAAPVVPLQIAVTPTEHFLFTFLFFLKTLYAVKVVFPSETFYKKEKENRQ